MAGALLCAAATAASALHVEMTLHPEVISVGESAELTIIVQAKETGAPPTLPDIPGLRVGRPTVEHTVSMTLVNGVREDRRFTIYRYTLIPLQPGEFTIGPFSYRHGGESFDVPAKELRVAMPGGDRPRAEGQVHELTDLVFAELSVNKERVYAQETFTFTIAIYSRGVNLGRDVSLVNMPDTGISTQPFQELRTTRDIVRGHVYDVRRYQTQIRPLTTGTIRFAPELRIQLLVPREERRGRGMIDDPFFRGLFSNMEAHPFDLQLTPVEVVVQPLPETDRPDTFTGGVGAFQFSARVQPTDVRVGDPITLTMMIEGEGNMDTVAPPSMSDNDLFRVYPPRMTNKDLDRAQSRGRKLYEQVLIPRSEDALAVPPLQFTYFDPEKERYETIVRGPFELAITGGDAAARIVRGDDPAADRQTRIVGQDIVYLKPAPDRWVNVHDRAWYAQPLFLGLQGLPPVMVLAVFLLARHRRAMDKDVARARRYRAPRSARAGIRRAEQALATGSVTGFHDGLWSALTSYFGDRLNLSPGSVTADEVQRIMRERGSDQETLSSIEHLFADCEQLRFAKADMDPERMRTCLADFRQLLKACERVKT